MERHVLPGLNAEVSALGFGCASLGSRIGARAGARLVGEALEAGITWFDLAPAYGAGQAEDIFARAIADLPRERVQICTKVGLLAPPQPAWKRLIMPLARQAVALAAPLRQRIRKSGVTRNRPIPLTPDLLRQSLERSLSRLGVDHVDVYALHNATPEALGDEALMRVLEEIKRSGKARAVAVASDGAAARAAVAARARGGPVDVVQCALSEIDGDLVAQVAAAGMGLVTHSVFGVSGTLEHARARLAGDGALAARHAALGQPDLAALRLMAARAQNPRGVTLCSMLSPTRLRSNATAFGPPPPADQLALAQQVFPTAPPRARIPQHRAERDPLVYSAPP